ncbi:MAG: hypothetical protein SPF19_16380 [Oliverpabstia sp.]|nr:hypothetical protein [Oliverpabstia sp.]
MQVRTKIMMLFFCVFCCLPSVKTYAAETSDTELPVIASWENGNGYAEDGTMLSGTWAYDSVNTAGKYVLFGEDGTVLKKSDQWENRETASDNFTATEQEPATIALRVEPFLGFEGTVLVTVEEKSGIQKKCELNQDNQYQYNLKVNSGDYALKEVEAYDDAYRYTAVFSPEWCHIGEKGIQIMEIQVTEERLETVEEGGQQNDEETVLSLENGQEEKIEIHQAKEDEMMFGLGDNKILLLIGGIVAAGMAGFLLLRSKKSKYQ